MTLERKTLFIKCYPTNYFNREKSLRHVAIIAKFSDDNKPKTSFKKWIRTVSNFFFIWQIMLAKFWGVESERTLSKFKKRKKKCVLFTYSIKREISNFHVAVVQRRQRNVEKSMMHVQSYCFANIYVLPIAFLLFSLLTTHFSSLLNKPLM